MHCDRLNQYAPDKKILIVDDHPVLRDGLKMVIEGEKGLSVCGECESPYRAIELIQATNPDMVIIDISLGDSDGFELIKTIKAQNKNIYVLVFSMHKETLYAEQAIRAGANGYLMKQESSGNVIAAIRNVLNGEMYVSHEMISDLLRGLVESKPGQHRYPIDRLSEKELEVFRYIGEGFKPHEIAKAMHLSVKTIETHRSHIKQKLSLKSATELVQFAIHWMRTESAEKTQ